MWSSSGELLLWLFVPQAPSGSDRHDLSAWSVFQHFDGQGDPLFRLPPPTHNLASPSEPFPSTSTSHLLTCKTSHGRAPFGVSQSPYHPVDRPAHSLRFCLPPRSPRRPNCSGSGQLLVIDIPASSKDGLRSAFRLVRRPFRFSLPIRARTRSSGVYSRIIPVRPYQRDHTQCANRALRYSTGTFSSLSSRRGIHPRH